MIGKYDICWVRVHGRDRYKFTLAGIGELDFTGRRTRD
jgi:hypothetical protein